MSVVKTNLNQCICVGISSMIGGNQLVRALEFSEFIKSQNQNIPIIFGGPLTTIIPHQLLFDSKIDFVIRGQGEQPMSDLVDFLKNDSRIDKIDIPGVLTKDNKKNIQSVFLDKNKFPPYPWHLLNVEKYIRRDNHLGERVLNYVSSQGCPYQCGYCSEVSIYQCRWKAFPAQRVLDEIQCLKETYHLDGIKFYDANFFVNSKRVIEFASSLKSRNLRLKWGASAHPCGVIKLADNLKEIKKSGLNRLLIGAESGLQTALDYINKGCTVEDNLRTAELCAKHHISSTFTFIVGIPWIEDDIEPTLKMVLEMKKMSGEFDIKIHFYAPFPGTPLFEKARKFGYCLPTTLKEWSKYDYYLIQTPWVNKRKEIKIRRFGDFYCDFLYPPSWFFEILQQNATSMAIYKVLRKLVEFRYKMNFYRLPIEIIWFKGLTNREIF